MTNQRRTTGLTLVTADGDAPTRPSEPERARASIAVLPLSNTGDPGDHYLGAGITEDVVTELSRYRGLQVIGASSSFACEPFAADTKRVAQELGCRYVLEGSVRRAGPRLRITVRLLDCVTGEPVMSDRHEGSLADVLAVQEDIARRIAASVEPALVSAEISRALRAPVTDLDAYDLVHRARALMRRAAEVDDAVLLGEALVLAQQAADRAPGYAEPFRALAWGYALRGELGFFGPASQADYEAAETAAQRVRELDPQNHAGHAIYGHVAMRRLHHAESLASLRHAHELNPNAVVTLRWLAWEEANHGFADEAREHASLSLRLSPRDFHIAQGHWVGALADYVAGDLPRCAEGAQRAVALTRHAGYRLLLAACLTEMGRLDEASEVLAEAARLCPQFVESRVAGHSYFARADLHDRFTAALRQAVGAGEAGDDTRRTAQRSLPPVLAALTERERTVLRRIAQGESNSAIGVALGMSEFTAKRHVANILMKLDLPNRGAAAALAARHGLV